MRKSRETKMAFFVSDRPPLSGLANTQIRVYRLVRLRHRHGSRLCLPAPLRDSNCPEGDRQHAERALRPPRDVIDPGKPHPRTFRRRRSTRVRGTSVGRHGRVLFRLRETFWAPHPGRHGFTCRAWIRHARERQRPHAHLFLLARRRRPRASATSEGT